MSPEEAIIRRVEGQLQRLAVLNEAALTAHKIGDLRPALIGLPGNALHSLLLSMAMADSTICQATWWNHTHQRIAGPNAKDQEAIKSLEVQMKKNFFIEFVSRIEWGYRKFASHLYPGKGTKGGHWSALYKEVHANLSLSTYDPLFHVCRCIRNTIHSNGIYIDKFTQKDSAYVWKGVMYDFKHLKPIDFFTWETLHILVDGNIDAIEALLGNQTLKVSTYIPDALQ